MYFDKYSINFSVHIDNICNKAIGCLDLEFQEVSTVRVPFVLFTVSCAPTRGIRQSVWSRYTVFTKTRLEFLQRRFNRLVGVQLGFGFLEVAVDE